MSAVTVGSQEALFGGLLRARGGPAKNPPVAVTFSQQRRAGPATGRPCRGRVLGGGLGAAPGVSHKPGSGGARAFPESVSGPSWGQARLCYRLIRGERAMPIGAIEEGA